MIPIVVERSGDRKLSATENVSATFAPQHTCHTDCPLFKNGCYAEVGRMGIHTHRLNARASEALERRRLSDVRIAIAKQEAAGIRQLTGQRKLRVHVVGDCANPTAARIVGQAMVEHEAKAGKKAWTYSHSWRHILASAWQGAKVLASVEKPEDIPSAKAMGYQVALVVPSHPTHKEYVYRGYSVLPCPAQFFRLDDGRIVPGSRKGQAIGQRLTTCERCSICQSPERLRADERVVGFEPDGQSEKRVLAILGKAA